MKKKLVKPGKKLNRSRVLTTVFFVLLGALVISLVSDVVRIFKNQQELKELEASYQEQLDIYESESSEKTKLQDPEYLLRYIREKYGYTKDGELIIRIDGE